MTLAPENLHVMHVLEATAGGSRKHLAYVVQGLRHRGVAVDLVLSRLAADPDFESDLALYRELGCRIHLLPMHKHLSGNDLAMCTQIRRLLAEDQPQVVHTHCAKAGLLGRLAARSYPQIRLVHTPHSFFFEGMHSCVLRGAGIRFERWLGRRTDAMFCVSEAEAEHARLWGLIPAERLVVGANGLPEEFFDRLDSRARVRRRFNIPEDDFVIGVLARLVPKKGLAWFLQSIAGIRPDYLENIRVYLFGHGPLEAELQGLAARLGLEDNVIFAGYEPGAERYLRGMDLGVLPSFYEGLAYQLLETVGAGVPLIATDVTGNKISLPGNPILYVQPGDTTQLARLVEMLYETPEERQRQGETGIAWVHRHFALAAQVDTLIATYQRLLAEPR